MGDLAHVTFKLQVESAAMDERKLRCAFKREKHVAQQRLVAHIIWSGHLVTGNGGKNEHPIHT